MPQIVAVLFAALVSLGFFKTFGSLEQASVERMRNSNTAGQLREFNSAVEKYALANQSILLTASSAAAPAVITVSMLQDPAVNLLDTSFGGVNPYGQTWQAQVLQPTPGNLRILSFGTGGTALPDRTVSAIAAMLPQVGGFVPRNDSGAYTAGPSFAIGSFAGYKTSTVGYIGLAGGRPVAQLTFSNGQLVSNYLYRNAVPGQPQLNQMNTTLDMNGNDVSNAKNITGTTVSTTSTATVGGNATIAGTLNVTGDISTPVSSRVGDVQINSIQVSGTGCPEIGRLARDSAGLPLSCQSGSNGSLTWSPIGGSGKGLSAVLAPLKGMTVSCGGTIGGSATVDANGFPYTRAFSFSIDTGYVYGNYASTTGGQFDVFVKTDAIGITVSTIMHIEQSEGGPISTPEHPECTAVWPQN